MASDQQYFTEEAARMAVVQFYEALQFECALELQSGVDRRHITFLQQQIEDLERRAPWLKQEVMA